MGQEKQFENKVKRYLEKSGAWFVKYWAGSPFTKVGIPDLVCCINGYFVAIELKSENGHVSEIQKYQINRIRESNGIAIVLYPNQFEMFKKFVKTLKTNMVCNNWLEQEDFDRR